MGVSTDAILCFGVSLEEETELPWDDFDELEEWWVEYVWDFSPPFEIYDEDGYFLDGINKDDPIVEDYYDRRNEFKEKVLPLLPVEVVRHCSCNYPMHIIIPKGVEWRAWRGYPQKIDPTKLTVTEQQIQQLLDFCERYKIEFEGEPAWWLVSDWC